MSKSLSDLTTQLRTQAVEIASAGHSGWGNTMTWAADVIDELAPPPTTTEDQVVDHDSGDEPVEGCKTLPHSTVVVAKDIQLKADILAQEMAVAGMFRFDENDDGDYRDLVVKNVASDIVRAFSRAPLAMGVPIGVNDKHGKPIHIGDVLSFDADEWGAPLTFEIKLEDGQILYPGSTGDLSEWCEIVAPFTQATASSASAQPSNDTPASSVQHCAHCDGVLIWTDSGWRHVNRATSCIAFNGPDSAESSPAQSAAREIAYSVKLHEFGLAQIRATSLRVCPDDMQGETELQNIAAIITKHTAGEVEAALAELRQLFPEMKERVITFYDPDQAGAQYVTAALSVDDDHDVERAFGGTELAGAMQRARESKAGEPKQLVE